VIDFVSFMVSYLVHREVLFGVDSIGKGLINV